MSVKPPAYQQLDVVRILDGIVRFLSCWLAISWRRRTLGFSSKKMADNYVIFDCDIGNDDAWALVMLIKAERFLQKLAYNKRKISGVRDPFKILGVTCVRGNTDVDNGVRNALRVLDAVDRLDVSKWRIFHIFLYPQPSYDRYKYLKL